MLINGDRWVSFQNIYIGFIKIRIHVFLRFNNVYARTNKFNVVDTYKNIQNI